MTNHHDGWTDVVPPYKRKKRKGADRSQVYRKTHGRCIYCGAHLADGWHVEHVRPIARGGTNRINNLWPSCADCNLAKGDKPFRAWALSCFSRFVLDEASGNNEDNDMNRGSDLIGVREAARIAGKSKSTVRDWIRAGHLTKHREDPANDLSRVLVSRAELLARLEDVDGPRPAPPTAADAVLAAELASARAMVASLEERLRLVGELRDFERAQFKASVESERVSLARSRESFGMARAALECAASSQSTATEAERRRADAERRRADAAEALLRDARQEIKAMRGGLVAPSRGHH